MSNIACALSTLLFFMILLCIHSIFTRRLTRNESTLSFVKQNAAPLFVLVLAVALFATTQLMLHDSASWDAMFETNFRRLPAVGQALVTFLMVIIAAYYYNVQFSKEYLWQFVLYSSTIYLSGLMFVTTNSITAMFVAYELILIPTSIMLDMFSKTSKSREATEFMVTWTQIGAVTLFLVMGFFVSAVGANGAEAMSLKASRVEINFLILMAFFGFAPKIPV